MLAAGDATLGPCLALRVHPADTQHASAQVGMQVRKRSRSHRTTLPIARARAAMAARAAVVALLAGAATTAGGRPSVTTSMTTSMTTLAMATAAATVSVWQCVCSACWLVGSGVLYAAAACRSGRGCWCAVWCIQCRGRAAWQRPPGAQCSVSPLPFALCVSHAPARLLPRRLVVAPPRLEVAVGVGMVHWRRRFRRPRRQR